MRKKKGRTRTGKGRYRRFSVFLMLLLAVSLVALNIAAQQLEKRIGGRSPDPWVVDGKNGKGDDAAALIPP